MKVLCIDSGASLEALGAVPDLEVGSTYTIRRVWLKGEVIRYGGYNVHLTQDYYSLMELSENLIYPSQLFAPHSDLDEMEIHKEIVQQDYIYTIGATRIFPSKGFPKKFFYEVLSYYARMHSYFFWRHSV